MKIISIFPLLVCLSALVSLNVQAQTGYIYVHLQHLNEESSPDYPFVMMNSSGTVLNSFSLNDQATADNVPLSGHLLNAIDLGLTHESGTTGGGQLWAIAATTQNQTSGTVYYRNTGSSNWNVTTITTATAIDGAYNNQFVYANTSGNVIFYNNGTQVTIYSSGNATDVTANGGRIAIVAGGVIKLYSLSYTSTTAPAATGTWSNLVTVNTSARLDMNLGATLIVYGLGSSSSVVSTVSLTGTVTSLGSPASGSYEVAYDDNGTVYTTSYRAASSLNSVFSYNGSVWTFEKQGITLSILTGGAGHAVFGIQKGLNTTADQSIYSRFADNAGNVYWIDDDRIKSSATLNGNGIIIPVTPGTYTVTETLPSSTAYDLGRYNIYDPLGSTTGNVNTNTVTYVVTAGEIVFAEYVNEKINPKAIALTCSFQYLQTFDATGSSPIYTYTYGATPNTVPLEGTSYHSFTYTDTYYDLAGPTGGPGDHTGNNGFFLYVNASFAHNEFYRQRVTNLLPGVSYTIAFWAANASPSAAILPNITFGLQDSLGNIVNTATTGTIPSASWTKYSFTFTATTSRADLFLLNNADGGNGNDIYLDDISINPVVPVLPNNSGSAVECVGSSYTFANTQSGGIWTSSNKAVATINAKNGSAKAVAAGSAVLTYTYTNSIGCTGVSNSVISVNAPPIVAARDRFGGTLCINQADSLYSIITTSSTAPYTYAWSVSPSSGGGLGTANIQNTSATPTAAGSYTFTTLVTDSLGCSASASVLVTVSNKTAPTVSASVNITSLACVSPVISTLTGGVSGSLTPNYSYVWSGPGTILAPSSGSTSATSYNTTATSTAAGQYTLTVTDGNGCIASATASTVVAAAMSVTASTYAATLCTGGSGTKDSLYSTVTGGLSPLTYAWTRTAGTGTVAYSPGATSSITGVSVTGATSGGTQSFSITVTDANHCTATANTSFTVSTVTGPTFVTYASATFCFGSALYFPASVYAGTGAVTNYVWSASPSATAGLYHTTSTTSSKDTALPTAAGAYTFTITASDANGCKASYNLPVQTINPAITVTATSATSAFCSTTGTDQLYAGASGGSGTYSTYAWTTAVVATPGTTSLSSTSIYNPVASISGASTGSAFKYTVTVTDNKSCTGTASTTSIVVATSPTVSALTATPSSTCASSSATIALSGTFSGGTSPYNYAWTPPNNSTVSPSNGTTTTSPLTASATAPVAQTYSYSLTVVDNNNCTATGSNAASPVTLNAGLTMTAAASTAGPICANPGTSINLRSSASGGTAPYTYAWAGPGGTITTANSQNPTAVPTTTGVYTVTATDASGCVGTDTTATVTVDQATPNISISCGTNSNSINYIQFYESNGSTWLWTTTSGGRFYTDSTLSVNSDSTTSHLQAPVIDFNGAYTVQITDAAGCIGSGSYTVTTTSCNVILATSNLNFTAEKQGNAALLTWGTSSETDNSYFNIERSADGTSWQVIGTLNGQGNSTVLTKYSFTDAMPLNGINYYRLKQVDVNGQYTYSPMRSLQFTGQWLFKLYPNPVQNYVVLEFNNDKDEKASITIQNALGSTVFITGQQLVNGLNRITLNQVQPLATGTYILTLATTENIFHSKFVKGGN